MFKKLLRNPLARKMIIWIMGVFSLLNQFIKKNDNLILFYDGTNKMLIDNSETFYNYLKSNHYLDKYDIMFCLPANKNHYIDGYKNLSAFKGIFAYMRAKYVFFCFGDMRIKPSKKQKVINLWHGMPIKKIGKYTDDKQYKKEKLNCFSYIMVTSDFFVPIFEKAFEIPNDKIIIAGQSRCDELFKKNYTLDQFFENSKSFSRRILWMPTFRNSTNNRFHDSLGFKSNTGLPIVYDSTMISELNKFCIKENILIVIKGHRAM